MLSLPGLMLLAGSNLLTSFISGVLGMAGGMILMGVMLAMLPLPAAMMLHGIAQTASNGGRALLLRRRIGRRVFGGYATGAAAALLAFAGAGIVVGKTAALIALGITPFAAAARPASLQLNVERRGHPLAGGAICSALLTAGLAGPILDACFVRARMSRHAVVATKAMTQCFSHALKIAYFGGVMAVSGAEVSTWLAAAVVLLALAGTSLARGALERISEASLRRWTRWTVFAMGAFYLSRGLLAAWS